MKRFFKIMKRIMTTTLAIVCVIGLTGFIFLQQSQFGGEPSGKRLSRIQRSPEYKNGKFRNTTATPTFAEGYGFWGALRKQLFSKHPRRIPKKIPAVKTNLFDLPVDSNVIVWFGHSSLFIQLNGKKILIDPVLRGNASPVPGSAKAFNGTDIYSPADIPPVDYLLISHDHYDHLDYPTVRALEAKVKKVVCGLGVGAHFERWGYPADKIAELDWHEEEGAGSGCTIYAEEARHKSGRGLKQNKTLWLSFVIGSPAFKIFYSGDGGYSEHFKSIGKQYGPFDLAIMENGQYDSAWRYVHLLPEETLKAAGDLNARKLLPVHNSKFSLGRHSWDDPFIRLSIFNNVYRIPLATPMIGEPFWLNNPGQVFTKWWEGLQ